MKGTITRTPLKSGKTSWGYVFDRGKQPDGKRDQITKQGFARKSEAEDALRKAIDEFQKPKAQPSTELFRAFFQRWLEDKSSDWAPKTRECNAARAAYALRKFGDVPMSELTPERLERDIRDLRRCGGIPTPEHPSGRPLGGKTVTEIASLVSQSLDKAVKWNVISSNPMEYVDLPKLPPAVEASMPTSEELYAYLERVSQTRYYAFSVFCSATGCRRGEALALRIDDVNWHTGEVVISKSLCQAEGRVFIKSTKGGKARRVMISATVLDVLEDHRREVDRERGLYGPDYTDKGLLFPRPDGEWYTPDQVTGRICEFMAKAGIKASLHSLRHMHASLLLSGGLSIPEVSRRLGHASSDVTFRVYAHALKRDESKALDIWDRETVDIVAKTRPAKRKGGKLDVRICEVPKAFAAGG